jgi:hypothetical protein
VLAKARELGVQGLIDALKPWGDWREMENGGICEYCGKCVGQPHSISGQIYMLKIGKQSDESALSQFVDSDAKYHSHGNASEDQFNPFDDPLFMEWIYLLDPTKNVIEVWHFEDKEDLKKIKKTMPKIKHTELTPLEHDNKAFYCEVLVAEWNINDQSVDPASFELPYKDR